MNAREILRHGNAEAGLPMQRGALHNSISKSVFQARHEVVISAKLSLLWKRRAGEDLFMKNPPPSPPFPKEGGLPGVAAVTTVFTSRAA